MSNSRPTPVIESCLTSRHTIGPWLFGVILDILLFSVLTVQTYVYYLAFPKDRKLLKLAVIWVYIVGLAQTVLAIMDLNAFLFFLGLLNGCHPRHFVAVDHFWLTTLVFSEAAALTAQWLYAYRIYVISHKFWIVILVICLSLGQLGTSALGCLCLSGVTILGVTEPKFVPPAPGNITVCPPSFAWLWGPFSFLCDTTITVSMMILLLKRREGTLKKTTHARISRVVRIVVETGLATSAVVVLFTLAFSFKPLSRVDPETIWLIPGLTMGKVYSNSMLALLNSRLTIVGSRNAGDPFDNSEIRSEVLRTEVGGDQAISPVIRRRITNGGNPVSA